MAGAAIGLIAAGPALKEDFPDPHVLRDGGRWLAYATNSGSANVQLRESRDLGRWRPLPDPLPRLPGWAASGFTWAPEVLAMPGRYILYFTARERRSGLQCIGTAVARTPVGPFAPVGVAPLVCERREGGSIDPSPFRDRRGGLWLLYKTDGNHPRFRRRTLIRAVALTADGLQVAGSAVTLLSNDRPWQGTVVEAPSMVLHGGDHILFFSANDYGWPSGRALSPYAIGWARCAGPQGPCTAAPHPFIASTAAPGCRSGPGHQSIFAGPAGDMIAFHAWAATADCRRGPGVRQLWIAPLAWRRGRPVLDQSRNLTPRE